MTEEHKPLDIFEFCNTVKSVMQNSNDIPVYQNFGEIGDLTMVDTAMVISTVLGVYVKRDESITPSIYANILKSVYDIFSEHPKCKDIISLENYVVAIIDSPFKTDIDNALDCVGKINALFKLVNRIREQKLQPKIEKGIGMNYGKVLMVKTSHSDNLVMSWDGESLSTVVDLSTKASDEAKVFATFTIYNNLKEEYQKLFSKVLSNDYYEADPVNIAMNKWIIANI